MTNTSHHNDYLVPMAEETLNRFEATVAAARTALKGVGGVKIEAVGGAKTITNDSVVKEAIRINRENREGYEMLVEMPAIARVVVEDEKGQRRTYYICRGSQGMPDLGVVSYRAPIGRLASLPIGEEFHDLKGRALTVLERAQLRPVSLPEGWDSQDTIVEARNISRFTIASLRAALGQDVGEVGADLLAQILAEENARDNIIEGVRRGLITKMQLRDQPVLDRYQDEIFRMPLNERLLILGPPGTGKTTTLIRRLGQKLDPVALDESERRIVEDIASAQSVPHADSWLMFTPTELLKQYLKEAFARERVPASDLRIRTWQSYRHELARNHFSVLRTATGTGTFVLKETLKILDSTALERPIEWFSDFVAWQRDTFTSELRESASALASAETAEVESLGEHLLTLLRRTENRRWESLLEELAATIPRVQRLEASLKSATDNKLRMVLNVQLGRDRKFLAELAGFIDGLQPPDADDQDEMEPDEEVSAPAARTTQDVAHRTYLQAVRAQARAHASRRSLSKTSRYGKIVDWLGQRTLNELDRNEVGKNLLSLERVRRFVNPVKRLLDGIPKRYRAFRARRQEERRWYLSDGFDARDLHPLELDLVLLAILRTAGELLQRAKVQRSIDQTPWTALKPVLDLYCNQILVDEATDFSAIQLACMASLARPQILSFFACGDFNQRLTAWGTRSIDDLKWIFPKIDIKEIVVGYRQSRRLNDFALGVVRAVGGQEPRVSLPDYTGGEGVEPALLERAPVERAVFWLAERIREIEGFLHQLPSIAIFVGTEEEVVPLADELNAVLAEHNILVSACRDGQTVGQEGNVRVFDVQHIKGLEFEAVFFVAIDRLASSRPDLFDKYLYVGTTRAATYLGITCEGVLPAVIEGLRPHFCENWRAPRP